MAVHISVTSPRFASSEGVRVVGVRPDLSPYQRARITRLDRAPRKHVHDTRGRRARRHGTYVHDLSRIDLE